jgi:phage protein D
MPKFVPIYEGRDFYVPAFDIKIKGIDLPKETRKDVIDVRYSDSIDQIDSFEITVNNWDAEQRDFKYTGSARGTRDGARSTLFDPGQEIEIWMGYFTPIAAVKEQKDEPEPLRLMLVGIITSLTPSFPATGQSTLKVRGQNVLRKLITKQETYVYEKARDSAIAKKNRDSDIAEKIGQRGNLKIGSLTIPVKTDSEAKGQEQENEHVLQDNQYDILFLLQRAHRNGYDVLLKYESKEKEPQPFLYFGPSTKEPRVSYILEWGKSLIQFQPTLTTTRQVHEVTVRGWNALKKKPIEITVNRGQLKTRGLRDQQKLQKIEDGFKERKEIIVDQPFRDEREAKRYAMDRLERLSKDMVTGRGSTVGIPDLRAGSIVELRGLGTTFDGNYFIKTTTHTIGTGGYTTEFEARLEEKN